MVTIKSKAFNWGGMNIDVPKEHCRVKKHLTSNIEIFDMAGLSWLSLVATGESSPAAVMGYSSCLLDDKIYFFGGSCMPTDCYHNDLFTLDTLSKDWRQIEYISSPTTCPMKKCGHEMTSFTVDNEDYLFVFGGYGPTPTSKRSYGQYVPHPTLPNRSFTNEVHMLCLSAPTGQ